MANHIVQHIDGLYLRKFSTGRNALSVEEKAQHRTISLSPKYNKLASTWKERTGQDFSSWVEQKMYEEIKVCIETV